MGGQIGLEPTPETYVESMVSVFADVQRVLADDGTVWLNLGDSFFTNPPGRPGSCEGISSHASETGFRDNRPALRRMGLKSKDLVGIPWRVAFALQADGWYLRSDIIWSKPNPMPESVQDRPTKAHEYIFLLSKSPRYYYDASAIREPYAESTLREFQDGYEGQARKPYEGSGAQNASEVKRRIVDKRRGHGRRHAGFNDRWDGMPKDEQQMSGANKRSVWHVVTQPYPDAHFATYPEKLIEPCILAGTSEKGQCPQCSKPWVRMVERERDTLRPNSRPVGAARGVSASDFRALGSAQQASQIVRVTTLGWEPSCSCDAGEPVPQTVLDPFCGSGTTGAVSIRLGRNFIGCELNPAYVQLAEKRIGDVAPLFAERTA